MAQDSGKYCFGVVDTLKALEMGAIEILIVWENLDIIRYVLKNSATNGRVGVRPTPMWFLCFVLGDCIKEMVDIKVYNLWLCMYDVSICIIIRSISANSIVPLTEKVMILVWQSECSLWWRGAGVNIH